MQFPSSKYFPSSMILFSHSDRQKAGPSSSSGFPARKKRLRNVAPIYGVASRSLSICCVLGLRTMRPEPYIHFVEKLNFLSRESLISARGRQTTHYDRVSYGSEVALDVVGFSWHEVLVAGDVAMLDLLRGRT
ncbi:hypothetical protein SBA3_880031 [Candidatus Sulfopaludibacter sp. SbA3]|nr:hypothetical protein SBA3_880031 [Candidatus Sulfopaludibacter sp. SbA3]